jgi:hypothetical protein
MIADGFRLGRREGNSPPGQARPGALARCEPALASSPSSAACASIPLRGTKTSRLPVSTAPPPSSLGDSDCSPGELDARSHDDAGKRCVGSQARERQVTSLCLLRKETLPTCARTGDLRQDGRDRSGTEPGCQGQAIRSIAGLGRKATIVLTHRASTSFLSPGQSGEVPGQSGEVPGQAGEVPGQLGEVMDPGMPLSSAWRSGVPSLGSEIASPLCSSQ